MRIRKGKRCLPLAPADRSFVHEAAAGAGAGGKGGGSGGSDDGMMMECGRNQALLRLVALAAVPGAAAAAGSIISGGGRSQYLEHANGTSPERLNKYLEYDLEKNRVSADDNFNERLLIHNRDIDSALRSLTAIPRTKSVFTRHEPPVTTGTICSSTSTNESQDQPDLLEQSLCHICSRAGEAGVSARDAVLQILAQGLPGLVEGGERLIVQVAKAFRSSSKFVEREERGRFALQDFPGCEEKKALITGDSEITRAETVSSTDMIEAARQLQNMQQSHSNSLGSEAVDLCETPSFHCGNHKAAQNTTQDFLGQSKPGTNFSDAMEMNQKSSSTASMSQNVSLKGLNDTQCKRDDGKGWRCSRPAEGGYTMCGYHREQICRAQSRRKRPKSDVELTVAAKSSLSRYVVNTRVVPDAITTASDYCPFLDDELAYDERRQFVKAKSLKSLLLNKDVRPKIFC